MERRDTIRGGGAFSGRGKRAAFALFYAPLHFLLLDHIVRHLPETARQPTSLVDVGCGTGAAGAAWAAACKRPPTVVGIDRHAWPLIEAALTYKTFELSARTKRESIAATRLPPKPTAIVAAFTMNELEESARDALLDRLLARDGDQVLIVEPLAGFVAPWWNRWRDRFEAVGGRSDEWRFRADLPPIVAKLDRAAGLDHREITGRSLFVSRATRTAARPARC